MKTKYYIQDQTGIILTCHSDMEMEEAWETLTNPQEASLVNKAKYLKTEPVGETRVLRVIAKQDFKNVNIHSKKERPNWH